jgi:hypothetical protein
MRTAGYKSQDSSTHASHFYQIDQLSKMKFQSSSFFSVFSVLVFLTSVITQVCANSAIFKLKLVPSTSAPFYDDDSYNLIVNPDDSKLYVTNSTDYITGYISDDYNLWDSQSSYEIGIGKNYFSEVLYSTSYYYPGDFSIVDGLLYFNGTSVFHAVYSSLLADGAYAFGSSEATGVAKVYYDVNIAAVDVSTGFSVSNFP